MTRKRQQTVDLKEEISELSKSSSGFSDFHVPLGNPELKSRANRLRQAVRAAGGNKVVATRSGVAPGTLNSYLAGGEMKLTPAVALAAACNVSLDWLATGREPMRPGEQFAAATPGTPSAKQRAIDVDRLAAAMEKGLQILAERGSEAPPARRFAAIVEILYSDFSDEEVSQIMERIRHENR
jgi:hypothetical protein